MRAIDRLDKYIELKGLNDNKVTVNCSLSVGLLGKARLEGNEIGKKAIEKVLSFYQDLNRVWLITGEGEMLKNNTSIGDIRGSNNTTVAGNGNKVNNETTDADKFLNEIAEQRKLTAKAQEQIDRLLSRLESRDEQIDKRDEQLSSVLLKIDKKDAHIDELINILKNKLI